MDEGFEADWHVAKECRMWNGVGSPNFEGHVEAVAAFYLMFWCLLVTIADYYCLLVTAISPTVTRVE